MVCGVGGSCDRATFQTQPLKKHAEGPVILKGGDTKDLSCDCLMPVENPATPPKVAKKAARGRKDAAPI